jgi:hypothetical protein
MIGDAEGTTMQREAKNTPAMAWVRLLGPIGRDPGHQPSQSPSISTVPSQKMLKVCISLSMVALARGFTANPASLSPAGAQRCMCRSADPEMFIG